MVEVTVHVGHLKLVLEVRDGAQATQDDARAATLGVAHQETIEAVDFDAVGVDAHLFRGLADHLHSLGHAEQWLLLVVVQHGDDDLLERHQATVKNGGVPFGDRVERPGINGDASHCVPFSGA